MTFRFDLLPVDGEFKFAQRGTERIRFLLSELQPARKVRFEGDPPTRIHVVALGEPADIAPGLLSRVEELAGTGLRFELSS